MDAILSAHSVQLIEIAELRRNGARELICEQVPERMRMDE